VSDHDTKRQAIIDSACEQVRGLLETNFTKIVKAADENFVDDERQTEPKAKAGLTIEWEALADVATVSVKLSWSIRYVDESESQVDPLQEKLGLDEDGGAS
jgi:hypothetical protein